MESSLWDKVKKKTNVNKDTIISLARKLEKNGFKDEKTLNEVIDTLSGITGKKLDDEKRKKIIDKVVKDKVPSNIDKMF